ncbi:MAG: chromosome segregation protein SMC, partial [Bacteroidetes bacterium]|nr:chromosome segregation protein SMC [Bacteroidota bacterium]
NAEKNVAVADVSIQNLQNTIAHIENEKQQRQIQLDQLMQEHKEKETARNETQASLQQLKLQQEHTRQQILHTQGEVENLRVNLAAENRKLDAKVNEHDLLKSLVDSMDGYPESVKFLHQNAQWKQDAPLLSDIIYVQEEYRAAVENLLEPYLNYYIVNTLQEGLAAIRLLDENKKGKANFFVLDKVAAFPLQEHPPHTLPALSVVEIDGKYAPLMQNLLGNVCIAQSDDALNTDTEAIVLEKSGKYVKGRFSITGGSVGLFEGKKIGRAKNLEKLQQEIDAQTSIVEDLKKAIQQKHDEVLSFNSQLQETQIQQAGQELNQLVNTVFALQNKIENLQHQDASAKSRGDELKQQLETTKQAIESTRMNLQVFNTQMQDIAAKMLIIEKDYASAEQEYNSVSHIYNEHNLQVTRQHSKVTSLKQELEFKTNQLNELNQQVNSSKEQLRDAVENLATTTVQLSDLEALVIEMFHGKDAEEKKLNEADQEYHNLRNILQQKESELRLKQRSKEGIDHLLNEIKDKLTDLKLQLAGIKERLSVEFKVELDQIIDEPRTTETALEELKEKCEKLKKRIENIGEVNPTAIEAFTEMKKRYEFISEQRGDLVTAKDSLLLTIQEVEATANQQFLNTFNQVRENFQKVFKALFTEEDTADMVLSDPENLAETGIDIVAKPKGKRPSSIGQLSGGEKTLTATALLFAIYLIKPAPFCILDEVDAPLDDANVGKFTNMIKQFSENSQFIIVTHNKQTMNAVDVIYGVTMQEAGVSKLVPVDFRNLN